MQEENSLLNEEANRLKLAIMRLEANSVYGADGKIRGPQDYYETGAFVTHIKDRRERSKHERT